MAEDQFLKVGDVLIDEYNDEIGILLRRSILLDALVVWDIHWTKRNLHTNDQKIHHYEGQGLHILIKEGALKHYPGN